MPSDTARYITLETSFRIEFYDFPTHTLGNLIDDRGKILLRAVCPRTLAPLPERHAHLKRWFNAKLNHQPLPLECLSLQGEDQVRYS